MSIILGKTKPTIQTFLSGSGAYTTPSGVKYIQVEMAGSGGGGAGAGANGSSGGGGSGGSYANDSGGAGGSGVIIVTEYYS